MDSREKEFFLLQLCDEIDKAEKRASEERKKEIFGDRFVPEFLLKRENKISVEIRKENAKHNAPHIHITHSDKINAAISLIDFSVLAGKIDNKTLKHFRSVLIPKKNELNEIWEELNEKKNSIKVEKLISDLDL